MLVSVCTKLFQTGAKVQAMMKRSMGGSDIKKTFPVDRRASSISTSSGSESELDSNEDSGMCRSAPPTPFMLIQDLDSLSREELLKYARNLVAAEAKLKTSLTENRECLKAHLQARKAMKRAYKKQGGDLCCILDEYHAKFIAPLQELIPDQELSVRTMQEEIRRLLKKLQSIPVTSKGSMTEVYPRSTRPVPEINSAPSATSLPCAMMVEPATQVSFSNANAPILIKEEDSDSRSSLLAGIESFNKNALKKTSMASEADQPSCTANSLQGGNQEIKADQLNHVVAPVLEAAAAPNFLDAIKSGEFKLKKVEKLETSLEVPNQNHVVVPLLKVAAAPNFLDAIKSGEFKLKKVEKIENSQKMPKSTSQMRCMTLAHVLNVQIDKLQFHRKGEQDCANDDSEWE